MIFLTYPLDVVSADTRDRIVEDVRQALEGSVGIRRYPGDSFWCSDYRQKMAAHERTRDFSDDLEARDRLCSPGDEAEWCIFDPVLSVLYGLRYQREGDEALRQQQVRYFNRALSQIDDKFQCPELWHRETGPDGRVRWETSDVTPLLWTQANLRLALHTLIRNVSVRDSAG